MSGWAKLCGALSMVALASAGVGVLASARGGAPARGRTEAVARRGLTALPVGAWGAVSAALGRDDLTYRVSGLSAQNPAQRLSLRFTPAGVVIGSGGTVARLGLWGVGRGPALARTRLADPRAAGDQVSYMMGPVREWFVNGPLGVEQGFDLLRRPSGTGILQLRLGLSGARVRLDGQSGALMSLPGGQVLRYTGLSAVDAAGRPLPAWLAIRAGRLSIVVDDRGARYPVRVDPFIQQGSKLVGSSGSTAEQGWSVAISSDGDTALVGGQADSTETGAAWVFVRSGGVWSQQGSKLTVSGEAPSGRFGFSAALSGDGNTALIGAPGNTSAGAAWVFTRSGGVWSQGQQLTANDETGTGFFGGSVALSEDGSTALIGGGDDNSDAGAAWVFSLSGGFWSQQGSKLTANDETGTGEFGTGVALSSDGNTALIGGPNDNSNVGAAWGFTRSGGVWSQQGSKLTASDETGTDEVGVGGEFGSGVALSSDGNTALIGGQYDNNFAGAAWEFTRSGGVWSQQGSKLTANDESGSADFGTRVALSGDGSTALIGGPFDAGNAGAAWAFSNNPALSITDVGSGSGTVTSSPTGINCGSTCRAVFAAGAQVTLTATPAPGSAFGGWSGGGCSGIGTCTLTLTDDQAVTATFSHVPTSGPPGPTASRPVLTGLSVSPRRLSLKGRLARGRCKELTGADRHDKPCRLKLKLRIAFKLSEAGGITVAFSLVGSGRRVNHRCVKPTHANRHKPRCERLTELGGSLMRTAGAGTNTISITRSALAPGTYHVTVTPSAAGQIGEPQTTTFVITS